MTQENKDILLKLLKQHKALGISDQIDFEKFYLDSLISNSVALADSEYGTVIDEKMVDKTFLGGETGRYLDFVLIKTYCYSNYFIIFASF